MQYGKVFPGSIDMGEDLHWTLIFFELLTPINVPLLLMPLFVRDEHISALDQYSQAKKDD